MIETVGAAFAQLNRRPSRIFAPNAVRSCEQLKCPTCRGADQIRTFYTIRQTEASQAADRRFRNGGPIGLGNRVDRRNFYSSGRPVNDFSNLPPQLPTACGPDDDSSAGPPLCKTVQYFRGSRFGLLEPVSIKAFPQCQPRAVKHDPTIGRGNALFLTDFFGFHSHHLALEKHPASRSG